MALSLVTGPAVEPISLTEAKLHLRVDSTTDDALIEGLVRSARLHIEAFTRRALGQQTWDDTRDAFPCEGVWWLEKPQIQSITSITYLDTAGESQTWGSSNYLTDLPSGPFAQRARITPDYGVSWPSTYGVMNAVTVRYVAGYGGTAKAITSITRSSTTATVTTTAAHSYSSGQRITIAGSDQAAYNATFEITVTGAATFTFTVTGSPTTPATGTMTAANLGIPDPILSAMKLLIGHLYENREAVNVGNTVNVMPMAVESLLWPYVAF